MHSAEANRFPSTQPSALIDPEMAADLRLEPEIAPAGSGMVHNETGAFLLTGATGFLGAFLLRDLVRDTGVRLVCLVRAGSAVEARARVETNLERFGIALKHGDWNRIQVVPGDLLQPRFGLDPATYDTLAADVSTVFHGAAVVNFYQTYRQLRETNVGGTREMLRFVTHGRLKALHYVSSFGVYDSDAGRGSVVHETDAPTHCQGSVMGYTQTKWVAEQLVLTARARGIPISVYRTPFIVGDSRTGTVDEDNLIVKMLLGCIQGGSWPDERSEVEMVPVDALSRAITYLASRPENLGRTFHITSPGLMRWVDIGMAARAYGYALAILPYEEWKRRLGEFARRKNNAMRPLLRLYTKVPRGHDVPVPEVFARPPRPIFDSTATQAALAPAGLVPPRMDNALFATYLGYFLRKGWSETPAEIHAANLLPSKKPNGSRPPYAMCEPRA